MRAWVVVLTLLLGVGCPANHHYKLATQQELAGREYEAAREYLEALRRRPSWIDAQVGLANVAKAGFDERVARAEELEAARNYREAARVYDELDSFVSQLRRYHADTFATPNLKELAGAMRDAAIAVEFQGGQKALAIRDWGSAFDHFNKVKKERPRYPGVDLGLARAWYGSATDSEANGDWRVAASSYLSAVDALGAPHEDAVERAFSIYQALGRYHVAKGACRQGWRDLSLASKLTAPGELEAELASAWACAEQGVVLKPLSGRFPAAVTGLDVPLLLHQKVQEKVQAGASEFVLLVEAGDPRSDFDLDGELVEAWAENHTQRKNRVVAGVERYPCQVTGADGVATAATCEEDVDVHYVEVTHSAEAQVQGRARVTHRVSRVQRAVQLGAGETAEVVFGEDFRNVAGFAVPIQASGDAGVILPEDVVALSQADQRPPDTRSLLLAAVERVADQLAEHILATVDAEPAWTDPELLKR